MLIIMYSVQIIVITFNIACLVQLQGKWQTNNIKDADERIELMKLNLKKQANVRSKIFDAQQKLGESSELISDRDLSAERVQFIN